LHLTAAPPRAIAVTNPRQQTHLARPLSHALALPLGLLDDFDDHLVVTNTYVTSGRSTLTLPRPWTNGWTTEHSELVRDADSEDNLLYKYTNEFRPRPRWLATYRRRQWGPDVGSVCPILRTQRLVSEPFASSRKLQFESPKSACPFANGIEPRHKLLYHKFGQVG
jgi:hypothetical protein